MPRLLHGDVRRTVKNRDGPLARIPTIDGIRLVALEPVDLERLLVAQEVVEGAVLLVQDYDVLDAVRVRTLVPAAPVASVASRSAAARCAHDACGTRANKVLCSARL